MVSRRVVAPDSCQRGSQRSYSKSGTDERLVGPPVNFPLAYTLARPQRWLNPRNVARGPQGSLAQWYSGNHRNGRAGSTRSRVCHIRSCAFGLARIQRVAKRSRLRDSKQDSHESADYSSSPRPALLKSLDTMLEKLNKLKWCNAFAVTSYGVHLGVRVNDPALLPILRERFPPGVKPSNANVVKRYFSVILGGGAEGSRTARKKSSSLYKSLLVPPLLQVRRCRGSF